MPDFWFLFVLNSLFLGNEFLNVFIIISFIEIIVQIYSHSWRDTVPVMIMNKYMPVNNLNSPLNLAQPIYKIDKKVEQKKYDFFFSVNEKLRIYALNSSKDQ